MNRATILTTFAFCAFASFAGVASAEGTHVDIDEASTKGMVSQGDGIVSAGQPDAAAFEVIADSGFVAIIDMRGSDEDRGLDDERATVESLGMDYVPFPITDRSEIDFDNAKELDAVLQGIDGPVLIHCGSGNRVGAMLALRHSLNGASDDEALAYGRSAGLTGLEGLVRERLNEN